MHYWFHVCCIYPHTIGSQEKKLPIYRMHETRVKFIHKPNTDVLYLTRINILQNRKTTEDTWNSLCFSDLGTKYVSFILINRQKAMTSKERERLFWKQSLVKNKN